MVMTEISPKDVSPEELDTLRTLVHETLPQGDLKESLYYLLCGLEDGQTMSIIYEEGTAHER